MTQEHRIEGTTETHESIRVEGLSSADLWSLHEEGITMCPLCDTSLRHHTAGEPCPE